jgi:hypothetical protein
MTGLGGVLFKRWRTLHLRRRLSLTKFWPWFPQPKGSGVTLDNKAYGVHRGTSVRVDLAHSVRRLRMAAICAKETALVDVSEWRLRR